MGRGQPPMRGGMNPNMPQRGGMPPGMQRGGMPPNMQRGGMPPGMQAGVTGQTYGVTRLIASG